MTAPQKSKKCVCPQRRVWLHPTMRTWFRGLGQVQWCTLRCQGIHHTIEARPPFGRWMLSSCDTHVELWGRYGVCLECDLREVPLCSLLITCHRWVAGNAGHTLFPRRFPGSAHIGTGSQRNPVSTDDTPPRQHLEGSTDGQLSYRLWSYCCSFSCWWAFGRNAQWVWKVLYQK